jgi:hypothetical protein
MEAVPEALKSVKPSLILKYWRQTQRIIQAYREGATFGDEEYRAPVYTSHRRVSQRKPGADGQHIDFWGHGPGADGALHQAPGFALNFGPHHFVPFDHHLYRVRYLLSDENIRAATRSISACTIPGSVNDELVGPQ